jgi:hypothetical protein
MENTVVNNVVLDKKFDGYMSSSDLHNFIAPQEITVTITISEYRELVQKVATRDADISKAESDRYERNRKIAALEKENAELRAKIYELQNKEEKSDET